MDVLRRRARLMENLFYLREDRKLLERQRELHEMEQSRDALARVSGIADADVLDKLLQLEVTPELLATLVVVPLVEIAWADGHVHDNEKDAILSAADAIGIGKGSVDYDLLERWLTHRPSAQLLEAWTLYINRLASNLSPPQRQELEKDLVERAQIVAQAAGGFLGLSSPVSPKEKAVIAQMQQAFRPE